MNRFERNHIRKEIEKLKLANITLTSGQIVWLFLGVLTAPTIILPYLCYGYIKKYSQQKSKNLVTIATLTEEITNP